MTKFLTLLRIFWKTSFRLPQTGDRGKAKKSQIWVYIVLAIVFLPIMFGVATGVFFWGQNCAIEDIDKTLTFLLIVCQSVVLFFAMFILLSHIFFPKDTNQLLHLPVTATTLFSAKLTVVYLHEMLTSLVLMVFVVLPFGMGAALGGMFYLMLLISLVLMPVLPMVLGCLVAFPISWIVRALKNKTALKIIVQCVLFIGIISLYMWFVISVTSSATSELEDNADIGDILQALAKNISQTLLHIYPVSFIAKMLNFVTFPSFLLNFAGAIGTNAAVFGILLLIAAPTYRKTLSRQLETGSTKKGKIALTEIKTRGVLPQLIFSDIKRTLRNQQLSLQIIMTLLMGPFMMALFAFSFSGMPVDDGSGAQTIWEILQVSSTTYQVIASVVIFGFIVFMNSSMNVLGMYPITRERQTVFLLRALPVSTGKILLSKVMVATIAMLISNILTVVLCAIFLHLYWYWAIVVLAGMTLYQFGIMCITTYLDVKSPVLNWTNFNASLKNAKSSFRGILIDIPISFVTTIISVVFIMLFLIDKNILFAIIMWVILLGIGFGFALLSYKFLVEKGTKAFERLE